LYTIFGSHPRFFPSTLQCLHSEPLEELRPWRFGVVDQ
jgi:hypothetical protein